MTWLRRFRVTKGSWLLKDTCPHCENRFQVGDDVTFHVLPPNDLDERRKAEAGLPHTAPAVLIHVPCKIELDPDSAKEIEP